MLKLSFGNGVTLAYFEHHPTRLFTASDQLDCRYVRAYFKQQGATAAQYVEPNLSNIYDAAEDLIALGNDRIALYITAANFRLCDRLTTVLKELDDSMHIVWFGGYVSVQGKKLLDRTQADGIIQQEPEQVIYALSQTEPEEWDNIGGFLGRNEAAGNLETTEAAHSSSLYELDQYEGIWEEAAQARQNPIFTVKCADTLEQDSAGGGLRIHSPGRFQQDLELAIQAAARTAGSKVTLQIAGFHLLHDRSIRSEMLEAMERARGSIGFQVEVEYEWVVKEGIWQQLLQAGITAIAIRIPLLMTEQQALEGISLADTLQNSQVSDQRLNVTVTLTDDAASHDLTADSQHTARLLSAWTANNMIDANHVRIEPDQPGREQERVILPEPIRSYLLKYAADEPQPALMNGYIAFMTGHYPGSSTGGCVKHIGYTEGTWNPSSVHRLGEYSGVNSALLFEHNQVNREEKSDIVYADQDGVWKQQSELFDELVHTAEQQQYYLSNAHQIVPLEECTYELQMNDFLQIEPTHIRRMDYLQAAQSEPNGDEVGLQFLEITSEEDLELFLNDVDHFSRQGKFKHGFEIQSYIVDSCRWSGAHHCRARELPRMFVDGQDQISACRGCPSIGDMYDSLDSLLTQVSVVSDQEQLLRGCQTCDIRDTCSKCSFLPSYMNRQQYCDLRRKHVMLHRYMQMVQLFKVLRKYTQALHGIGIQDIKVSLPTVTHLWPNHSGVEGAANSLVQDTVFLFYMQDQPMLFHSVNQKILKLNELTALILEGFMAGADEVELIRYITEKYQVETGYAASAVSQAEAMFAREGCLKKMSAKAG